MLRDRPLMCLFLVATVVVDLVLVVLGNDFDISGVLGAIGFVLGQVAAMAFWAVNGQTHRLARGAWLVTTLGIAAYLGSYVILGGLGDGLAFFAMYTSILIFVALLTNMIRYYSSENRKSDTAIGRWQISLIELFGWTTVVAIASFGGRHMDFDVFRVMSSQHWWLNATLLVVPVFFTLFVKRDLRDLNVVTAFLITAAFGGVVGFYWWTGEGSEIAWLILAQTAYLLSWFFVSGLDSRMREAKAARVVADKTHQAQGPEPLSLHHDD